MRSPLVAILLIICGPLLLAQGLPEKVYSYPTKYLRPTERTTFIPVPRDAKEILDGKPWIVYSDRPGNPTYLEPKVRKRHPHKMLNYLESFYVVEDSNEFIHIIKDPYMKRGVISGQVEDFGWVEKSKMLLWESAIGDRWAWKIKKRVLLYNDEKKPKKPKLYKMPDQEEEIKSTLSPMTYFVYKIDEELDMALIGRTARVQYDKPEQSVIGWVSRSKLYEKEKGDWLYLEPNWDKDALAERNEKKIYFRLFKEEQGAQRAIDGLKIKKKHVLWKEDSLQRRNGNWFRFPILEIKDNIAHVAYFNEKKGVYVPAYVPLTVKGLDYASTKFVRLLSHSQLGELIDHMDQFQQKESLQNFRFEIQRDLREMLRPYVGPQVTMAKMSRWSMGEITDILFGLPTKNDLSAVRMQDLIDDQKVSDETLAIFLDGIVDKTQKLEYIFNLNVYTYGFRNADQSYFWIEEDLLP